MLALWKHVKRCEKWENDTDGEAKPEYNEMNEQNRKKKIIKRNRTERNSKKKMSYSPLNTLHTYTRARLNDWANERYERKKNERKKNWFSIMQTYIFYVRWFCFSFFRYFSLNVIQCKVQRTTQPKTRYAVDRR